MILQCDWDFDRNYKVITWFRSTNSKPENETIWQSDGSSLMQQNVTDEAGEAFRNRTEVIGMDYDYGRRIRLKYVTESDVGFYWCHVIMFGYEYQDSQELQIRRKKKFNELNPFHNFCLIIHVISVTLFGGKRLSYDPASFILFYYFFCLSLRLSFL